MKKAIAFLVIISALIGVSGCGLGELVSQAPTATPTPSRTPKPTFTPLVTETPTEEDTPTATNTPVDVPTDTPTPLPTATNTPIPPPTPTSPPPPPAPIPTPTPMPVLYPCVYVDGPDRSMAGKPGEGTPSSIFEGYLKGAAGNELNNYGVYFENPNLGTACVVTGDSTKNWPPGFWKHEFWDPAGIGVRYYITIKQSCDPGAPALSIKEDFLYSNWDTGHHKNIIFGCSF